MLKKNKEFVINLPTVELLNAVDFCGVRSGEKINKIQELGLELEDGDKIATPSIKNSPVNLECVVKSVTSLGSHDMFTAEIVSCRIDDKLLDENGVFRLDKANLLAYCHGYYYSLGKKLGKFGFSVEKDKTKKKKEKEKRALSNLNKVYKPKFKKSNSKK
ncbi:MAG: Flavoredoxin [Alphaproteobacteria bacterium ADurb.Bin438]|nr:MAG: Flavoredoxin [Alphaproteobacteria bacterium ADurb.Bin438]